MNAEEASKHYQELLGLVDRFNQDPRAAMLIQRSSWDSLARRIAYFSTTKAVQVEDQEIRQEIKEGGVPTIDDLQDDACVDYNWVVPNEPFSTIDTQLWGHCCCDCFKRISDDDHGYRRLKRSKVFLCDDCYFRREETDLKDMPGALSIKELVGIYLVRYPAAAKCDK